MGALPSRRPEKIVAIIRVIIIVINMSHCNKNNRKSDTTNDNGSNKNSNNDCKKNSSSGSSSSSSSSGSSNQVNLWGSDHVTCSWQALKRAACRDRKSQGEAFARRELGSYGGFPKLGVPFLGVPIIRTIVFWGLLILGSPHFGKLPY